MHKCLVSAQAILASLRRFELHAASAALVAIALALCVIALGSVRGQAVDMGGQEDLIGALTNCFDANSVLVSAFPDQLADIEQNLTKQEANSDAALQANAAILQSLERIEELIKSRRGITM
ncbi:MAG: hypothetical protein ACR2RF_25165 [Geminicoccaceae bacterium]